MPRKTWNPPIFAITEAFTLRTLSSMRSQSFTQKASRVDFCNSSRFGGNKEFKKAQSIGGFDGLMLAHKYFAKFTSLPAPTSCSWSQDSNLKCLSLRSWAFDVSSLIVVINFNANRFLFQWKCQQWGILGKVCLSQTDYWLVPVSRLSRSDQMAKRLGTDRVWSARTAHCLTKPWSRQLTQWEVFKFRFSGGWGDWKNFQAETLLREVETRQLTDPFSHRLPQRAIILDRDCEISRRIC